MKSILFIRLWLLSLTLLAYGLGTPTLLSAQLALPPKMVKGWQLMDYQKDSVYGTDVNKAYRDLLKGLTPHRVLVAVIDGGVDTAQPDLKGRIWTNPGEIPGNGVDDDHNGYIDDIHGWDFIGGKNGKDINHESDEASRVYAMLSPRFSRITDSNQVDKKDLADYREWLALKQKRVKDSTDNTNTYRQVARALSAFGRVDSVLKMGAQKDSIFLSTIQDFDPTDSLSDWAKTIALRVFSRIGPDMSLEEFISEGNDYEKDTKLKLDAFHKDPEEQRRQVVGDNPYDIQDTHYGNNDVEGPDAMHGTHVSGIIAADRNNGIGMDGVTNDVEIMSVRVVPDGDERDKDVALGIRYAVDNGAEVINMSFGKYYSPGKKWVDDAVKYAEKRGVLLIHAAGNESSDNDSVANFPNADFMNSKEVAGNFINIGASTSGPDSMLVAAFSNYGAKKVDFFAPGVNIYSTVPDSQYRFLSGTSMASPVVTGIAALILEYYPTLSAEQVKFVLDHSVEKFPGLMVEAPGSDKKILFSSLSEYGGIVNAYNALKLAATLKGKRNMNLVRRRQGKIRMEQENLRR